MKRLIGWSIIAAIVLGVFHWPEVKAHVQGEHLDLDARTAILIDAESGEVLYAMKADDPVAPASVSKLMTELLVLEAVRNKEAGWDDQVAFSRYAVSLPGAETGLSEGEDLPLSQVFEAMAIHSANDAAVAAAEFLAGSETQFVERMNKKAEQLGLSDKTRFMNASGLSSVDLIQFSSDALTGETEMTARDTAKLAAFLLREYPELLEVTGKRQVELNRKGTVLATTNWMLPGERYDYPGNDGLKTGYTEAAGYCYTGTTMRDGKRLIAVVMGTPTIEARFTEAQKLFEYGFQE